MVSMDDRLKEIKDSCNFFTAGKGVQDLTDCLKFLKNKYILFEQKLEEGNGESPELQMLNDVLKQTRQELASLSAEVLALRQNQIEFKDILGKVVTNAKRV